MDRYCVAGVSRCLPAAAAIVGAILRHNPPSLCNYPEWERSLDIVVSKLPLLWGIFP